MLIIDLIIAVITIYMGHYQYDLLKIPRVALFLRVIEPDQARLL